MCGSDVEDMPMNKYNRIWAEIYAVGFLPIFILVVSISLIKFWILKFFA